MKPRHRLLLPLMLLLAVPLGAQEAPLMGYFKPIYFTGGLPTDQQPTRDNFDLKFQFSVALNFLPDVGGSGVDLFFGYTQLSIWDYLAESYPFRDNMYMPGVYGRYRWGGNDLVFGYEHRSNGKVGLDSRGLNCLMASITHDCGPRLRLAGAARWGTGHLNDDDPQTMRILSEYLGYVSAGALWRTRDDRWTFSAAVTPHSQHTFANLNAEVSYRFAKRRDFPRLFLQYHYGYDECMLDCLAGAQPPSMLRIGLVVNPDIRLFL